LISAGLPLSQARKEASPLNDPDGLIDLALTTGASLKELVRSKQNSELANFAADRIAAARALSVSLLVPLGLTMLPAFLIFTVLPMVIGINQQ
jgi:tight adherence protein B